MDFMYKKKKRILKRKIFNPEELYLNQYNLTKFISFIFTIFLQFKYFMWL